MNENMRVSWKMLLFVLWISAITTKVFLAVIGKTQLSNVDAGAVWLSVFSILVCLVIFVSPHKTDSIPAPLEDEEELNKNVRRETEEEIVTPEALKAYVAPNDSNNVSIEYAVRFGAFMNDIGLPYELGLFAYSQNSAGPAGQIPLDTLIAEGVAEQTRLNIYGNVKQIPTPDANGESGDEPNGHNIALETALFNMPHDDTEGYVKLYTERHQGTTREQAIEALEALPVAKIDTDEILGKLRTFHGVK